MDPSAPRMITVQEVRKLLLPSGIPNIVDALKLTLKEAFAVTEEFSLQYMGSDFQDDFTVSCTDQIWHKDTIKVVFPAPVANLRLFLVPAGHSKTTEHPPLHTHTPSGYGGADLSTFQSNDALYISSQDTLLLSPWSCSDRLPWPQFSSLQVQMVLEKPVEADMRDGTLMTVQNGEREQKSWLGLLVLTQQILQGCKLSV